MYKCILLNAYTTYSLYHDTVYSSRTSCIEGVIQTVGEYSFITRALPNAQCGGSGSVESVSFPNSQDPYKKMAGSGIRSQIGIK